jgi:hypothetical protein
LRWIGRCRPYRPATSRKDCHSQCCCNSSNSRRRICDRANFTLSHPNPFPLSTLNLSDRGNLKPTLTRNHHQAAGGSSTSPSLADLLSLLYQAAEVRAYLTHPPSLDNHPSPIPTLKLTLTPTPAPAPAPGPAPALRAPRKIQRPRSIRTRLSCPDGAGSRVIPNRTWSRCGIGWRDGRGMLRRGRSRLKSEE